MPLNEYPPGSLFPGVIGRTADESSLRGRRRCGRAKGAPNVLFIVLDDTGFGQLGCYGSPIETPNFDGSPSDGLRYNNMHTTALCSPSRSCIVTGRNHHANGMACITELATGYPGLQRRDAVRERDAVGDAARARLQHVHGRQVASDAEQPGDGGGAVRPLAARARLRALLRLPRRRHEPVVSRPRLRQPPGRAAEEARGGLPPERGPGRQGDLVHRRRQAGRPATSRSTCTSASARRTPRTTWRRSGRTSTRACSTTAGTPTARRRSRGRRSSGSSRRRRALTPRPGRARLGLAAAPTQRRLYAG